MGIINIYTQQTSFAEWSREVKKNIRFFMLLAAIMFLCSAVYATMAWNSTFFDYYKPPEKSALKKASCGVCHTKTDGTGGLNSYGKMLDNKEVGVAALKSIEKEDADKDGFSNIDEIKAGTLPGDKLSKPEKKKTDDDNKKKNKNSKSNKGNKGKKKK